MQAVAIVSVIVALFIGGAGRGLTLDAIMTALCVALALKLFETNKPRDYTIIYSFTLLLIGIDLSYQQDVMTWIICAIAFVLLVAAMVSFQYSCEVPVKEIGAAFRILLLVVPVSAMFCILMPAEEMLRWSLFNSGKQSRMGMSDSMAPGDVSNLIMSDELAFSGVFRGTVPDKSKLYWRAVVLDHFDGKRWSTTNTKYENGIPNVVEESNSSDWVSYKLDLQPSNGPWVPVLDNLVKIQLTGQSIKVYSNKETSEVRRRYPLNVVASFSMQSNLQMKNKVEGPEVMSRYLQIPSGNELTKSFAKRIKEVSKDEKAFVSKILSLIHNEQFFYTLTPGKIDGADQIDQFLFTTREGFCEHYSSAFVVLLRSAGIPSRVVTGYQGISELTAESGRFEVRQSEAHAWTEYWTDSEGWIRVDPTGAINPLRVAPKPKKSKISAAFSKMFKFMGSMPSLFKLDPSELVSNQEQDKSISADVRAQASQEDIDPEKRSLYVTIVGIFSSILLLVVLVYARARFERVKENELQFLLDDFYSIARAHKLERGVGETLLQFSARISQSGEGAWVAHQSRFIKGAQVAIYSRDGFTAAIKEEMVAALELIKKELPLRKRLFAYTRRASDIYL